MDKALKIIMLSIIGLLLSSNQLRLAQATAEKNQNVLMEIEKFFMGLSGVKVDKFGKPLAKYRIILNCATNASLSMGNLIARYDNPNYRPDQFGNIGTDQFGNTWEEECKVFLRSDAGSKISQQEQEVFMKINDFFMALKNQGKVMIVSKIGAKLPDEMPIARYMNPDYKSMKSGLIGLGPKEVLVYAVPMSVK